MVNRPVMGSTMVSHLGPRHRQFKIVRLLNGRRVILDQGELVYEVHRSARALYAIAWRR